MVSRTPNDDQCHEAQVPSGEPAGHRVLHTARSSGATLQGPTTPPGPPGTMGRPHRGLAMDGPLCRPLPGRSGKTRMNIEAQGTAVQDAFTRQAEVFDVIDRANPLITWVRERVQREVLRRVGPGMELLDINAGSGIDSLFFAERAIRVLATDNAPGMVAQLREKQRSHPHLPIRVAELSFHDLHT